MASPPPRRNFEASLLGRSAGMDNRGREEFTCGDKEQRPRPCRERIADRADDCLRGRPFQGWARTRRATMRARRRPDRRMVDDRRGRNGGRPAQAHIRMPQVTKIDHGRAVILPGFVDAHVHYPQTAIIASWGKRLIDWLNSYTFPEEKCASHDPDYAREIAERFFDLSLGARHDDSGQFLHRPSRKRRRLLRRGRGAWVSARSAARPAWTGTRPPG